MQLNRPITGCADQLHYELEEIRNKKLFRFQDSSDTKAIKRRWVVNVSDKTLNNNHLALLTKGMNFAIE